MERNTYFLERICKNKNGIEINGVTVPENLCSEVEVKDCNNKKGAVYLERFRDVLTDPNNFFIPRCSDAGKVVDGTIVMHNGLKIYKNSYYGSFSNIFRINKGVHEPSEERMFAKVLEYMPKNGVMIELGSYFSFYSMWFRQKIKNGRSFMIEPSDKNLEIGKKHFSLNFSDIDDVTFTKGFVPKDINIVKYTKENNIDHIDILHSDIQGSELKMLMDIEDLLNEGKVSYLFISTHSRGHHVGCTNFLIKHGYRIVASADHTNETFCCDGIIVACRKDIRDIEYVYLGNRLKTPLYPQEELDNLLEQL